MAYQRNTAATFPIGTLIKTSDGSRFTNTTGMVVRVKKDGGAWATGAGTLTLVETNQQEYTATATEMDAGIVQVTIDHADAVAPIEYVVDTDIYQLTSDAADGAFVRTFLPATGPLVNQTAVQTAADAAIAAKLPGGSTLIAGAGVTNTDLDDVDGGEGATVTEVTADEIGRQRTFYSNRAGNKARNIVTLNTYASGTVTLAADFNRALNPDTAITTVDSVTVTNNSDASTITTSNLRRQKGLRKANFDVAAIATAGTFTVRIDITTTDSQALSYTGTLEVE